MSINDYEIVEFRDKLENAFGIILLNLMSDLVKSVGNIEIL